MQHALEIVMVYCYNELITLSQWITSHTLAIRVIRSSLGFHSNRATLNIKLKINK